MKRFKLPYKKAVAKSPMLDIWFASPIMFVNLDEDVISVLPAEAGVGGKLILGGVNDYDYDIETQDEASLADAYEQALKQHNTNLFFWMAHNAKT